MEHQIDLEYSIESWFLTFELSLFSNSCVPWYVETTLASRKATKCL